MSVFDSNNNYIVYNVGIYLRLSKEDENTGQSESIENQRKIVENFISNYNWNIVEIYIDDGFSGLNFNRPAFKRMLEDIENKKINLVITKDLSRLGRDYIYTGYYLERYFPTKNIRYIAISDEIDTYGDNGNNDISPFKSVINDMYAKDISKKIRAVMDTKRLNGEFIGAFAPYGYLKDPNNRNTFIIDDKASKVVKRIFDMYIEGNSMGRIVKILNDENIPCPSKYKSTHCSYKNAMVKRYKWCQETVKRILSNPTYIGNMTQHRQEKISYKIDKFRKIPCSNWITVEGTHEPIISPEIFETVQNLIKRQTVKYSRGKESFHLLNGLVFCKECGRKMTYRRDSSGKMIMNCITYTKFGKSECTSHRIREELLTDYVINDLKRISKQYLDNGFFQSISELETCEDKSLKSELRTIEKRFEEIKNIVKSLYEDKIKGTISEEDFLCMTKEYSEEKSRLQNKMETINDRLNEKTREFSYIKLLKDIAEFNIVNKVILLQLIDRIEVDSNRKITVYYMFTNPQIDNTD